MKRYAAILASLLLSAPAAGGFQSSPSSATKTPAGLWEGTLKTPNGDLQLLFNVHRDGDKWAGEMDVPLQSVSGLPLANVKVDGASISFSPPGAGDPHYDGKLSEDGKTISGNFNAGGNAIPMDLKWKSEPRAVEKAAANVGDVQVLVGEWEGVLDAAGQQLHVRFHFVKGAGGDVTGTFDSVDQGANGLPIAGISRAGDTVKLDMKTIGCAYEGTLSKDSGAINGTFTQGGATIPLNLQRKAAK